ncbi:Zinc knuckle CX2CX4HX4C [Parasponia andersonii]|uniref:Zinc knuckle CX2CX4HX4C n=1 Tax=Parasponia andersonii TaxID=3476 RepID=A0A2P5B054_PARAD|nr:Zinc knuckle CX2CX4HX4C [Parasponia andersonii]
MLNSNHLRFRVEIRLDKPLRAGFTLPKGDGSQTWVDLKYERLPITCFKCGIVGHEHDFCNLPMKRTMATACKTVPLYGPWLRWGSKAEHCFSNHPVSKAIRMEKRSEIGEVPIVDTRPKQNMQSTLVSMRPMSVTKLL